MTDTSLTDVTVFPEDKGTNGSASSGRDIAHAVQIATLAARQGARSYIETGFVPTAGGTIPAGTAFVRYEGGSQTYDEASDSFSAWDSPVIFTVELHSDETGLAFETDASSDVYLAIDLAATDGDGAYIRHGSAVQEPTDPSVKLGVVDTAAGEVTPSAASKGPVGDYRLVDAKELFTSGLNANLGSIDRDALWHYTGAVGREGALRNAGNGEGGTVGTFAKWIWFVSPIAIHLNNKTYVGYNGGVTGEDNVVLSRDHNDNSIVKTTLASEVSSDDHVNPAVFARNDGYILCFWTGHNGGTIYYKVSSNPEDISSFGPEQTLPQTSVTYPQPVQMSSQTNSPIRLHYRERAGTGDGHLYFRESTDGGGTFSSQQRLVSAPTGHYGIYFKTVRGSANGRVHYFCSDAHGVTDQPKRDVAYCYYSEANDAYYDATDTQIAAPADLPMSFSELETVYDSSATGNDAWVWDCGVDSNGDVGVAYATFPTSNDHEYHVSVNSGGWYDQKIAEGGESIEKGNSEGYYSAGISMDAEDPRNIAAATYESGRSEIAQYRLASFSDNLINKTDVFRSEDIKHYRPVVPDGGWGTDMPVVWLSGSYPDKTQSASALRGVPNTTPQSLDGLETDHVTSLGTNVLETNHFSDGISLSAVVTTGNDVDSFQTIFSAENAITLELNRLGTTGSFAFALYDGSGSTVVEGGTAESNTTYLVEGKWDPNTATMELWVDGKQIDSAAYSGPVAVSDLLRNWTLNRHSSMGSSSPPNAAKWLGDGIKDYRLLLRPTTDDESKTLYRMVDKA
jgi:hypothetical protein